LIVAARSRGQFKRSNLLDFPRQLATAEVNLPFKRHGVVRASMLTSARSASKALACGAIARNPVSAGP
jgi:hypothetical protein